MYLTGTELNMRQHKASGYRPKEKVQDWQR